MEFEVGCVLGYQCSGPATLLLAISPREEEGQRVVEESLQLNPELEREHFDDAAGNRLVRLHSAGGKVEISYQARVARTHVPGVLRPASSDDPGQLPPEVLPFLFPSRYCESDRLVGLASQLFGHLPPGYATVEGLCGWIHEHIEYRYGTTDAHTSACDLVLQCVGVCRDFAHLGIAFCRSLGIPARFGAGYAYKLDPPDFHAWFEVYLSGKWYPFDATRKVPLDGLVRVATGRDATDTSFANLFGAVEMSQMQVWSQLGAQPESSGVRV